MDSGIINCTCCQCKSKAIAVQDNKLVCLEHFSKIYHLTGRYYEERYKI